MLENPGAAHNRRHPETHSPAGRPPKSRCDCQDNWDAEGWEEGGGTREKKEADRKKEGRLNLKEEKGRKAEENWKKTKEKDQRGDKRGRKEVWREELT